MRPEEIVAAHDALLKRAARRMQVLDDDGSLLVLDGPCGPPPGFRRAPRNSHPWGGPPKAAEAGPFESKGGGQGRATTRKRTKA